MKYCLSDVCLSLTTCAISVLWCAFRLALHQALELYWNDSLHLSGRLVEVALLRTAVKETRCRNSSQKKKSFAYSALKAHIRTANQKFLAFYGIRKLHVRVH